AKLKWAEITGCRRGGGGRQGPCSECGYRKHIVRWASHDVRPPFEPQHAATRSPEDRRGGTGLTQESVLRLTRDRLNPRKRPPGRRAAFERGCASRRGAAGRSEIDSAVVQRLLEVKINRGQRRAGPASRSAVPVDRG